jgi:hypothetical protein
MLWKREQPMSPVTERPVGEADSGERPSSSGGEASLQPLKQFRESRWGIRRTFTIEGDQLTLEKRSSFGGRTMLVFELRHVGPRWTPGIARNGVSAPWIAAMVFAVLGELAIFASWRAYSPSGPDAATLLVLAAALAVLFAVGLISNIAACRDYQFAGFRYEGYPSAFIICKLGPDVDQFDAFLNTLVGAIRKAEAVGKGASPVRSAVAKPPDTDGKVADH